MNSFIIRNLANVFYQVENVFIGSMPTLNFQSFSVQKSLIFLGQPDLIKCKREHCPSVTSHSHFHAKINDQNLSMEVFVAK